MIGLFLLSLFCDSFRQTRWSATGVQLGKWLYDFFNLVSSNAPEVSVDFMATKMGAAFVVPQKRIAE
jgi:hypothetical protein